MSVPLPVAKYRIHEFVTTEGQRFPIVLNARGGSSALVALSNCVLLDTDFRSDLETEGGIKGRPKYVRKEALLQVVEMGVMQRLQAVFMLKKIDAHTMLKMSKIYMYSIKLLAKGFSVTPKSTSCTEFEESLEQQDLQEQVCVLFDLFGAPLRHASVVDPKEDPDVAKAIGSKDHSDKSKGEGTAYWLRCLHESIGHLESGVLFKDNHYSLLSKYGEKLFCLQADEEQVKKEPGTMWKELEEAVDSPIKQQMMKNDDESIALKMQKDIIEEETRGKMKKSKPSKRQRDRHRNQLLNELKQVKTQLEVPPKAMETVEDTKEKLDKHKQQQEPQGAEAREVEPEAEEVEPEETEEERDDDMSKNFMHFLTEFKEEGTNTPVFIGQVKALHYCGSFCLNINFKDLEKHHIETAKYICNNMPRISERLRFCVCKFLLEHDEFKTKPAEVYEKTRLRISDLPAPNSVKPFSKFAEENGMCELWELFDYGGKKVSAPTYLGRKAGLGYLRFILKKHKAGRCWGGGFSLADMVVMTHGDGSLEFVITKEASGELSQEKAIADFNRFCVLICRYFMDDEADVLLPAYFDQIQIDYLVHMPSFEDKEAYDKWYKYMYNHFAFKAPQVRSILVTQTYEVFESKCTESSYTLLRSKGFLSDWATLIQNSGSVSLNYTYVRGNKTGGSHNHYDLLSHWELLKFGRHYCRHMLTSKLADGTQLQFQDLSIADLMLGHVLEGQMAVMIRFIMEVTNFDGGLLSSAWRHFEASETFDEVKKEVMDIAEVPRQEKCAGLEG